MMAELPSGTVTFLATDVVGATRLMERYPAAFPEVLARHIALLRRVIEAHAGVIFSSSGDGLMAAFPVAAEAVMAALEAQREQRQQPAGELSALEVRMALHTAIAMPHGGDYYSSAPILTSRLCGIAQGNQLLLSQAAYDHVSATLPSGATLRDLGEHRLRDLERPERVYQLIAPDLSDDTSPKRVLATILFTDIVDSTATAVELGDQRWRMLLASHYRLMREHLPRFGGREVRSTGDGIFAAFDAPSRAIEYAATMIDAVQHLGMQIRAGVHTGECELVADALEGVAVHIAARVCALALGNQILVSSTVTELVAGSGIVFHDHGSYSFKGLSGEWRIFVVAGTPTSVHVSTQAR